MANDLSDTVRDALGSMVREAIKNVGDASPTKNGRQQPVLRAPRALQPVPASQPRRRSRRRA